VPRRTDFVISIYILCFSIVIFVTDVYRPASCVHFSFARFYWGAPVCLQPLLARARALTL